MLVIDIKNRQEVRLTLGIVELKIKNINCSKDEVTLEYDSKTKNLRLGEVYDIKSLFEHEGFGDLKITKINPRNKAIKIAFNPPKEVKFTFPKK